MPLFGRYLLVGFANTILGFAVIVVCYAALGFSAIAANAAGYAVGFVVSFFLNRTYTFRSKVRAQSGFVRFALAALVGYCVNLLVLSVAKDLFGFGVYISQALSILSYLGTVFLISKWFVFGDSARSTGDRV